MNNNSNRFRGAHITTSTAATERTLKQIEDVLVNGSATTTIISPDNVQDGTALAGTEKGPLIMTQDASSNAAPLTTTASGSLNSNVTAISDTALTLGLKAMAASIPVVVSSDQATIPVDNQNELQIGTSVTGAVGPVVLGKDINDLATPLTMNENNHLNTRSRTYQVDPALLNESFSSGTSNATMGFFCNSETFCGSFVDTTGINTFTNQGGRTARAFFTNPILYDNTKTYSLEFDMATRIRVGNIFNLRVLFGFNQDSSFDTSDPGNTTGWGIGNNLDQKCIFIENGTILSDGQMNGNNFSSASFIERSDNEPALFNKYKIEIAYQNSITYIRYYDTDPEIGWSLLHEVQYLDPPITAIRPFLLIYMGSSQNTWARVTNVVLQTSEIDKEMGSGPTTEKTTRVVLANDANPSVRVLTVNPSSELNDLQVDKDSNLKVSIQNNSTAFDQFQIAEETPTFTYTFSRDINSLYFHKKLLGTAVSIFDPTNGGEAQCSSASGAANTSLLTSKIPVHYRNGQEAIFRATIYVDSVCAAGDGRGVFWGLTDRGSDTNNVNGSPLNAIVFGCDDAGMFVAIKNNDAANDGYSELFVRFANCNGEMHTDWVADPAYIPIDKYYAYEIRMAYLGAIGVVFRMYDNVKNRWVTVHTYRPTPKIKPFVANPILSFGMYAINDINGSTNAVVSAHSLRLAVVGKNIITTFERALSTIVTSVTTVPANNPILCIRCKETYIGQTNFARVLLENLSISVSTGGSNNLTSIILYKNATATTTPNWTSVGPNSLLEYADPNLASPSQGVWTIPSGVIVYVLSIADNSTSNADLRNLYLAPGDTVILWAQTAASSTFNVGVGFHEDF